MRDRLAFVIPYVALAGLLGIIVALGAWMVQGVLRPWIEIVGGLGLGLLVASAVVQPSRLRSLAGARQARYGGNALLMSVAFVVLLGLVNYLGARHARRWDVTSERQYSLSEQTLQILAGLEEPIRVSLFFTPSHYNRLAAEDLIKEYAVHSRQITYEVIDPQVQRRLAIDYQVGRDGTIIFERGVRREITFGVQEQDLTGALLKVTRDRTSNVYFLTGQQERDPEGYDSGDYGSMKGILEAENYAVGLLNLAAGDALPDDIDVLIVAGPQIEISLAVRERLIGYLDDGGRLLILVDPGMPDPLGGLTEAYGVALPDDLVLDPTRGFFGDMSAPVVDRYTFHQITKDLTGLSAMFPTVRSVEVLEPSPAEWRVEVLAESSTDSWAEADYRAAQVARDSADRWGPIPLMVAVEAWDVEVDRARLVIVGDSDLCSNEVLGSFMSIVPANVDLLMNAVGWLAEEEELISIRPRQFEERVVLLTAPQARAIIYSNIIFLPLGVLLAGGIIWWRRR